MATIEILNRETVVMWRDVTALEAVKLMDPELVIVKGSMEVFEITQSI